MVALCGIMFGMRIIITQEEAINRGARSYADSFGIAIDNVSIEPTVPNRDVAENVADTILLCICDSRGNGESRLQAIKRMRAATGFSLAMSVRLVDMVGIK